MKKEAISFKKFHGGTLTGGHCYKFFDQWEVKIEPVLNKIFNDAADLKISKGESSADLKDHIQSLLSHVTIITYVFNHIYRLMYRKTALSVEDMKLFGSLCALFGELWRKCGFPLTPKFHILERHLHDYMVRFHRLGILSEDIMERSWIADHKWDSTYSCVLNWKHKTTLKHRRMEVETNPAVSAASDLGKRPLRDSNSTGETGIKKNEITFEDVKKYLNLIPASDVDSCDDIINDNIYASDNEWQEEIVADVEAGIELQDGAN